MQSKVYEMVQCPSVCLPQHGPTVATDLLLWARWAGDIDQLLQQ